MGVKVNFRYTRFGFSSDMVGSFCDLVDMLMAWTCGGLEDGA